MPYITFENFNHRMRCLNYNQPSNTDVTYGGLAVIDEVNSLYIENNAIVKIQNWRSLSNNTNTAFSEAVDTLIDIMLYSDSLSKVRTQYQYLREEAYKVKNAQQLKESLKRKFSNMKNMSDEKGEIKKKLRTPLQAKVDPTGKKQTAALPTPGVAQQHTQLPPKPEPVIGLASRREAVIEECCNGLYEEACIIYDCDRIMGNANLICEQFQIDSIFNEYALNQRDLYDAIYTTTASISSTLPFTIAYNTALETCWYTLSRKHLPYTMDVIIEAVTDYFIFNTGIEPDEACFILEHSPLMEDHNYIHIRYLSHTHKAHKSDKTERPENARAHFKVRRIGRKSFSEAELAQDLTDGIIKRSDATPVDDIISTPVNKVIEKQKRADIHDLIKDFRKSCSYENQSSWLNAILLNSLADEIIKVCPEQIPNEFSNLLAMIRMNFIFYGNLIDIPGILKIVRKLISATKKVKITDEQSSKIVESLDNEIRYVQFKASKINDDDYQEEFIKYIDGLQKIKARLDSDSDMDEPIDLEEDPEEDLSDDDDITDQEEI